MFVYKLYLVYDTPDDSFWYSTHITSSFLEITIHDPEHDPIDFRWHMAYYVKMEIAKFFQILCYLISMHLKPFLLKSFMLNKYSYTVSLENIFVKEKIYQNLFDFSMNTV